MAQKNSAQFRLIGSREIVLLVICAVLSVVALCIHATNPARAPLSSAETRFVETSSSGLEIVPASCPSSPHSSSDCSMNSDTGTNQSGGCTITASPTSVLNGGNGSTLSWYVFNYNDSSRRVATISNISLSNVGTVARSGSTVVNPTSNTTYTLSGRYMIGSSQASTFSCSVAVGVTNCPSDQVVQNNRCVEQNTLICPSGQHAVGLICICDDTNLPADANGQCTTQVCPSGFQYDPGSAQCVRINQCTLPPVCSDSTHVLNQCSGAVTDCVATYGPGWSCQAGSCRQPPPPIASISAVPSLVAPNVTSNIAWTSTNSETCTVRGSNGDGPWTGTSGSNVSSPIISQTVYTLTCRGYDDSTITRTATINIIPNWQEQ